MPAALRLEVAPTHDHLTADGRPHTPLVDTLWSVLTSATQAELATHLALRRQQGFDAALVNLLPQWDRSLGADVLLPYELDRHGMPRYERPEPRWWPHAVTSLELLHRAGMTPMVVLLWADVVPGTWLSSAMADRVLPPEHLESYLSTAIERTRHLHPVYVVSGDADLTSADTLRTYQVALDAVAAHAPGCLATLHPWALEPLVPEPLAGHPALSFWSYQSGHVAEARHWPAAWAERLGSQRPHKPVADLEPCYEGLSLGGRPFDRTDVRSAICGGVLAGATAAIAYGAHGVWNWHRSGCSSPVADDTLDTPYRCNDPLPFAQAARLPGADDAATARQLVTSHRWQRLTPRQDLLVDGPDGARVAVTRPDGRLVLYSPTPRAVTLGLDLRGWRIRMVSPVSGVEERWPTVSDGRATTVTPPGDLDWLLLAEP
ncbi:MAG: DUF4038 domain-containing protein [Acidimicrobiia bacterium]|nr:DUF4038 domain-containing protein [Acidimicrobiia bacterium]